MMSLGKTKNLVPTGFRLQSLALNGINQFFLLVMICFVVLSFLVLTPKWCLITILFLLILSIGYFVNFYKKGFVTYKTKQNIIYEFYGLDYYIPKEDMEKYLSDGLRKWIRFSIRKKFSIKKMLQDLKPPILVKVVSDKWFLGGEYVFGSSNPFLRITRVHGPSLLDDEIHMHQINLQISYLVWGLKGAEEKDLLKHYRVEK